MNGEVSQSQFVASSSRFNDRFTRLRHGSDPRDLGISFRLLPIKFNVFKYGCDATDTLKYWLLEHPINWSFYRLMSAYFTNFITMIIKFVYFFLYNSLFPLSLFSIWNQQNYWLCGHSLHSSQLGSAIVDSWQSSLFHLRTHSYHLLVYVIWK